MSILDRLFKRGAPATRSTKLRGADLFDEDFLRRLETLALMSRRATAGVRRGERRSRKKGGGVEFADHRAYVPGDDIRFLDLGVYQRFGKLLLRLFEEEEDLSLYFLIDSSASMSSAEGAKFDQAKKVAAALAYVGLSGLDRVSVLSLSDRIEARMPPTRGKQRMFQVLRFLSDLKPQGRTDLAQGLKTFVAQHKRRGIAILLTDLFDPQGFEAGINVLRFNKFEPVVLQLVDQADESRLLTGDLELSDVETGATREVSMTPQIEEKLRREIAERQRKVSRFCSSRGVPHFLVDVETPFDEVVLSVLRSGGLLR